MKEKKFIVLAGNVHTIIAGEVRMHLELRPSGESVVSGGRYYLDEKTNTLYLFGDSVEYGKFTKLQIANSDLPEEWKYCNIVVDTDVMTEFELLFKYDID